MRMRVLLTVVVIALVGLVLVTFGSAVAPDAVPDKPNRTVANSRLFMLLPDGKVELTDARGRRVYQWDGQQWLPVELSRATTSVGEMQ